MRSRSIDQLTVGESASFGKTITESDIAAFAAISGDFNPLHVNAEYAAKSRFGARVAHGPICLAIVAGVMGGELPGLGTIAVTNEIEYLKPVFIGDTITARVTVAEIDAEARRVRLTLDWENQDGQQVAAGSATVIPPRKAEL